MGRTLLIGRAGSGKTHACLTRLVTALGDRRRALLLVPTYSQAEHLRYRLLDRAGGIGSRTIETFTSLSERVAGQRLSTLVSAPDRDQLAASVLARHFPEAADQAGFRAEFLRVVKELKEQGDPVEQALQRAHRHFPDESRGRRLFDAYADYRAEQPGPDHEDLLLRTRDHLLETTEPLALLLVDGFHDFTPVQREILDGLAKGAEEAVVTLPVSAIGLATAQSFTDYARQELGANRRCTGALAHLEQSLFKPPTEPVKTEDVRLYACASEEDEVDRLARFVARSKRPFNDFLLVRRSFDGVHSLYRAAFARHNVPLRFYGTEPLGRTPAARAATLWLRWRTDAASLTEVLPLLRSPFLEDAPRPYDVDDLAKQIRKAGEPDDLDEFPDIKRVLTRKNLAPFSVGDALIANPDGDEDLARSARFFTELKKEIEANPDEQHLLRRIPLIRGSVRDRRHDCVYAVEAGDARQWEQPVVLVAGLTSDSFPHQPRQDIFLRDDEREAFGESTGLRMPQRMQREDEEQYLFYVAVTRAKEQLVLSYAAFDEQGTPRPPSPYVQRVLDHVQPLTIEIPLSEQFAPPQAATRPADLLPIVADGLMHPDESPVALSLHDLKAVDRDELSWPLRLALRRTLPIALPAGVGEKFSASSLNSYVRCPFLFLARNVLRVQPAREPALDPLTRGNIIHDVLERYGNEGGDAGAIFDEVFKREAGNLRRSIEGEYWRRWMRRISLRAAEAMEDEEQYLFYVAVTRAKEQLVLSYAA
ncbi:MAG: PD-(D/E)XK nuclease family protein, partial [Planctomycetota bacterium]